MKTIKTATLLAIIFISSYSVMSSACVGTFYAVEGPSNAPTGHSLWTFERNGSVVSSSSSEPVVPFSTSQGNWNIQSRGLIRSLTFDFSGPNPNPSFPNVVRVDATFNFQRNCKATVPGTSKFSVISCPVAEGPLCSPGQVIVSDSPIELTKVAF